MRWILALALALAVLSTSAYAQGGGPLDAIPYGQGPGRSFGFSPFLTPRSYPPNVTSGHAIPWLDSDAQFGNSWSQYPLGSVGGTPLTLGKAHSSIGSAIAGQIFSITFTSSGIAGSPKTKSVTAGAGDDTTAVATRLCAAVNADPALHDTFGLPILCQAEGNGSFNLQYAWQFTAGGATPLTTSTTGSTGIISLAAESSALESTIFQLGRNVANRGAQVGDGIYSLDFTGQNSSGPFSIHYGQISVAVSDPNIASPRGKMYFTTAGGSEGYFDKGFTLFDASGVAPVGGTIGLGTINIPSSGSYSIDNAARVRRDVTSKQLLFENAVAGIGLISPLDIGLVTATGVLYNTIGAPAVPASGAQVTWVGATDKRFHDMASDGSVGTTVKPVTATAGQVVTGLTSTGDLIKAQVTLTLPTLHVFTTGTNAVFTTPAGAKWMEVALVGAGGGGGGAGPGAGNGADGTPTCVNITSPACTSPLYGANGGGGGKSDTFGVGGGILGTCGDFQNGGHGGAAANTALTIGGIGGPSRWSGEGANGIPGFNGGHATVNSGSGAGGGGAGPSPNAGGGGAGGGWCFALVPNPAASYFYTIGTGGALGTAGTGGGTGGIGGGGKIQIIVHYN
jgi:hypothetical protein